MTINEAKKLLPPNLKYPLPDGVIDNLINCTSIPCQFDIKDEDGTSENLGYAYALLAALIELKERRERDSDGGDKTCPFCGSDSIEVYTHYGESAGIQYGGYYPECTVCGCRLNYHDSREEALKAWNERGNHDRE